MEKTSNLNKNTPVNHSILESIKNRWSPRVFAHTPIAEKDAKKLLEAGRWAPSASNLQPWRVIWGLKGSTTYDRIFNCLDEFNQSWAGNSQMLWLNAFKKTMNKGEQENFHALHDLGLFMGNVVHQANSMEMGVHQMAGIDFKKAQKEFQFTEEYHVATAVAFGYFGGDPDDLPADLKEQELKETRERKSQDKFAFNGNFQNK
ncbi:nitroreductase family protein [Mesonia sp.]|uniref:nitroreductase family protein n=1 Tax=Mesonia sp. TaxID=1960830 RepID=UPI003F966188